MLPLRGALLVLMTGACGPPASLGQAAPPLSHPDTPPAESAAAFDASCAGKVTPDNVSQALECRLRQTHPSWEWREAAKGLVRITTEHGELELAVDNLEAQCETLTDCAPLVERWLRGLEQAAAPPTAHPDQLRLLVRSRDAVAAYQARTQAALVHEPCVGEELECLVVAVTDAGPGGVRPVTQTELPELGLSDAAEVLARALDQTLATKSSLFRLSEGVYVIRPADAFAPTRLLDQQLWEQPRVPLRGAPVVLPAGSDAVYVTGSDEPALADLRTRASVLHEEQGSPLTATLFMREGRGWRPLPPGPP